MLQLLRIFCQHETESFLFVCQQLFLASYQIILRTLEAPSRDILRPEKLLFTFNQVPLLLNEVLLDLLPNSLQLPERFVLSHVVLEVAAQVDLEEITEVGDMVARPCTHLR